MKKQDVPQDEGMYGIHRRACYAQDENGNYVIVPSKGWDVEKAVNSAAVKDIKDQIAAVRQQVESGQASTLAYHMARCQMTPALLAANSGVFQWRVKRHLKPGPFAGLDDKLLGRYADALAMNIDDLKNYPNGIPILSDQNEFIGIPENDFLHSHAAHCESGTVTTLLRNRGLNLSEAMVFGIGGGLFFLHLPWIKLAGMPLTAYRDAPRSIINNICKRLGVRMRTERFRTPEQGRQALDRLLAQNTPVGIQANIFWLPYFPEDMRFQYNGHNMVVYGKRGSEYLISDPVSDRVVTCSEADLQRARFAKGMFAPKGMLYYPEHVPSNPDLKVVVPEAIRKTVKRMLDIPLPIFGVRGIHFLAKQIRKWPQKLGPRWAAANVANVVRMQEEIGTGGAGFRFIYAAFLQESAQLLGNSALHDIAQQLSAVGDQWRDFAVLGAQIVRGAETGDDAYQRLADIVDACASGEESVYRRLREVI